MLKPSGIAARFVANPLATVIPLRPSAVGRKPLVMFPPVLQATLSQKQPATTATPVVASPSVSKQQSVAFVVSKGKPQIFHFPGVAKGMTASF